MTTIIDRSMSSKEVKERIAEIGRKSSEARRKKLAEKRRKSFGKAYLDISKSPVELQREWAQ